MLGDTDEGWPQPDPLAILFHLPFLVDDGIVDHTGELEAIGIEPSPYGESPCGWQGTFVQRAASHSSGSRPGPVPDGLS